MMSDETIPDSSAAFVVNVHSAIQALDPLAAGVAFHQQQQHTFLCPRWPLWPEAADGSVPGAAAWPVVDQRGAAHRAPPHHARGLQGRAFTQSKL